MSRREIIVLEDDLDGGTAEETISYGLDGMNYEIDLSKHNADKLRASLAQFLAHSRRLGKVGWAPPASRLHGRSSGATAIAASKREQNKAIREWAKKMGYQMGDLGVIPKKYVEEFHACGGIVPKKAEPVKTIPAQATGGGAKKTVATKTAAKKAGSRR